MYYSAIIYKKTGFFMGSLTVNKQKLKPFTITTKPIMEKYLAKIDVDLSDYTFAANYIWLANCSGFYAVINKCFCLFIMTFSIETSCSTPSNSMARLPREYLSRADFS